MSKAVHAFSVGIAAQEGLIEAILLQHIHFLQTSFAERDKSLESVWVKRSVRALHLTYPYLTDRQIRNALERMEERNLIASKTDNAAAYDRTKSFQLSEKGWAYFGGNAFDILANGNDERANGFVQNGESYKGSYSPFIDSDNSEGASAKTARLQPVEAETTESGQVAAIPASLTYDQCPLPKSSQELRAALGVYFSQNETEWTDGVLEQGKASNWPKEKLADCLTKFCAHQEAEGNMRRTYGQYKGMLVKWFLEQPRFDAANGQGAKQIPPSGYQSTRRN